MPPASLRVTVHPSVESFGRATGQPWWVSGATDGASIDLLPITMLGSRAKSIARCGMRSRMRLLDGALAKRPMWVREGAAAYFAAPGNGTGTGPGTKHEARGTKPDRVPCPSDIELLRPISAGAQRDAYARAEACFAREIAEGTRWDQVR